MVGEHAWLLWGTRSNVATGAVPSDRDCAIERKPSPVWYGTLAHQVYVWYDVLFLVFLSLIMLYSVKGIPARNMIVWSYSSNVSLDLRLACLCIA